MHHPLTHVDSGTLTGPLLALQLDAAGDWHGAHEAAQSGNDRNSAWVHAYLHRKEGDRANAEYWYRRAGQPSYNGSLTEEWQQIVDALTGAG